MAQSNKIKEAEFNHFIDLLIQKNMDKTYLVSYRNELNQQEMSPRTIYNYMTYSVKLLDNCNKQPQELLRSDYINYMASLTGGNSQKLITYSALRKFSKYLFLENICFEDFMSTIKKPKQKESTETIVKRENGFLTQEEISIYLANVKNGVGSKRSQSYQKKWRERDLALVQLLLNTGIRISAVNQLDIEDINFENGFVYVPEKGDKTRKILLNKEVLTCLGEWLKIRKKMLDEKNVDNEPALFISAQYRRMTVKAMQDLTIKYGENIDGKTLSPHKLRATFGTQVYNATGNIYLTQQAMGHSSVITTERYIREPKDDASFQAASVMEKLTHI